MTSLSKKVWEGTAQFLVALGVLLFLSVWSLYYWQGWLYLIVFGLSIIYLNIYFLKRDPKLLQSRLSVGVTAEQKTSQKIIQGFASIFVILIIVTSGLDYRFHWSNVSPIVSILADVVVVLGMFIVFLVFKENTYTSATVEVQKHQTVTTTGPYSIVRHPMYLGALFAFYATPIALGSWWGVIFSVSLTIVLILRLLDEEKFLAKDLKGYKEYCKKVQFHLVPFVW